MGELCDLAGTGEAARLQLAGGGGGLRDRLAALMELAAEDNAAGFREALAGGSDEEAAELADGVGLWYGRAKAYEPRTPLMVAATYGSVTVVSLLLGLGCVDVNRRPGVDGATALHCAASGGSRNAVSVVKLLLAAGADPVTPDSASRVPADVIMAPPALPDALVDLEMLLGRRRGLAVATSVPSESSSPPLSTSPDGGNRSPSSRSSSLSPITVDRGKKEYPVDPTLPDIKSSLYANDEFRMYSFKVRPCSRAYSHDWTECPFVHPGENARRRDPRKHPYTAVPCPNFRRPGGCPSGDSCEFSHGVFESWLHPSQYRTRLCKEGAACTRRICFFAHDEDELRHVPHNSGAGLLSPRASSTSFDMTAAAALGLLPGSPRHFMPAPGSPSSANNGGGSAAHWLQGSRLRSSFNARDAQSDDPGALLEWESQYLGTLSLPQSSQTQPRLSTGLSIRPTAITPSLEEMYASDMSMSPRFTNDQAHSVYSPAHKSAILNKLHQQKGLLSPVNTNRMYSPRGLDQSALMHSPFGGMSPRSPRAMEPTSPLSARSGATVTQRDMFDQFSSLNNKYQVPPVGSPRNSNASWGNNIGTPKSKVNWGVDDEELVRLRYSSQPRVAGEEPDVSWVQSLVNHTELNGTRGEMAGMASRSLNRPDLSNQANFLDQTSVASWLEQMHFEPK